jgi:hypothetical protein
VGKLLCRSTASFCTHFLPEVPQLFLINLLSHLGNLSHYQFKPEFPTRCPGTNSYCLIVFVQSSIGPHKAKTSFFPSLSLPKFNINLPFKTEHLDIQFFVVVLVVLVWTQGLAMLGKHSATWAMTPALFFYSYFSDMTLCFLHCDPPTFISLELQLHLWAITPGLFVEMGCHKFLPGLVLNLDPPCLHLQIGWDYTGVSHCFQPGIF